LQAGRARTYSPSASRGRLGSRRITGARWGFPVKRVSTDGSLDPPARAAKPGRSPDQRYAAHRAQSVGPLLGLTHQWGQDSPSLIRRSSLYCNGKPEREGFEPSWRVTPPTAFPESVRSLTGPAWDRLLNTLQPLGPTATNWLRLPIGIGVGITQGLGWTLLRNTVYLNPRSD
jgi:hypothetical protein